MGRQFKAQLNWALNWRPIWHWRNSIDWESLPSPSHHCQKKKTKITPFCWKESRSRVCDQSPPPSPLWCGKSPVGHSAKWRQQWRKWTPVLNGYGGFPRKCPQVYINTFPVNGTMRGERKTFPLCGKKWGMPRVVWSHICPPFLTTFPSWERKGGGGEAPEVKWKERKGCAGKVYYA